MQINNVHMHVCFNTNNCFIESVCKLCDLVHFLHSLLLKFHWRDPEVFPFKQQTQKHAVAAACLEQELQ
jgi:hypothetical protein